jgi:hypothetical protein
MAGDDTLHILAAIAFGAVGLFLSSLETPVLEDAGPANVMPIAP